MVFTKEQEEFMRFLSDIGLSKNESMVYMSALKLGNAIVKDIAKLSHLNRTTTYNLLLVLRKQGFVASYQKNKIIHFSATSPDHIRDMLDERSRKNAQLKEHLNDLLPVVKGLFHSQAKGSQIQIFEGLESLPNIYRTVYKNVRYPSEGLEFTNWGGRYDLFPETLRFDLFQELKKKDIWSRSLLIEDELTKQWVKKGTEEQRKKVKLLPNPGWDFFCNLEMCENRFAIVTYKNDVEFQGVFIESTELSTMFRFLFDTVWNAT